MDREVKLELIFYAIGNMDDEKLEQVYNFIVNQPKLRKCKNPDCDVTFAPKHNHKVYCSDKCSHRVRNKRRRLKQKEVSNNG